MGSSGWTIDEMIENVLRALPEDVADECSPDDIVGIVELYDFKTIDQLGEVLLLHRTSDAALELKDALLSVAPDAFITKLEERLAIARKEMRVAAWKKEQAEKDAARRAEVAKRLEEEAAMRKAEEEREAAEVVARRAAAVAAAEAEKRAKRERKAAEAKARAEARAALRAGKAGTPSMASSISAQRLARGARRRSMRLGLPIVFGDVSSRGGEADILNPMALASRAAEGPESESESARARREALNEVVEDSRCDVASLDAAAVNMWLASVGRSQIRPDEWPAFQAWVTFDPSLYTQLVWGPDRTWRRAPRALTASMSLVLLTLDANNLAPPSLRWVPRTPRARSALGRTWRGSSRHLTSGGSRMTSLVMW